ncbi:MAG: ATP-binding protein [bacterium]
MKLEELLQAPESAQLASVERWDASGLEAACAFANATGGTLLVPLPAAANDDSPGAQEALVQPWLQQIRLALQPAVHPEWKIQSAEGRDYLVLHIAEAIIKPVALSGRSYQRLGNSNNLLSSAEIARLHFQSVGKSWDALPHEAATLADVDAALVQGFLRGTREKRAKPAHEQASPAEILEKQGLLHHTQLTNAALLLFAKHPQHFIPYARIKAGRFKSETLIIDDQEITGPLFEQIDAAFAFIKKHLTVRLVITGQPQREEVWDYPLEAVREALINAICHRDYAIPAEIQIRIYDDQLIIWNPGSLPPDLQLDDLKRRHRSVLRNKLIGTMFYEAGLVEKWGSGTNRMIEECKKIGLPEPEWREHQGLMLILKQDSFTEDFLLEQGLNERQIKAVAHVKKRRRITNQEYQKLVEVKKRTASEDLRQLEEKSILERVGSTGKGTYYKLRGR